MYYAVSADVVAIDTFPHAAEIRQQLALAMMQQRAIGSSMVGALFVMMQDVDSGCTNMMPVTFDKYVIHDKLADWKGWMMQKLNEGIVS